MGLAIIKRGPRIKPPIPPTPAVKYTPKASPTNENIVNNALIYGPNGSGKSNLGFAIFDIISNISDKQKRLETYSNYLNADSISELAEFKYEFVFDNIIVK